MVTETNDDVMETQPRRPDSNAKAAEITARSDLVWDGQVRGLCMRVYGNGSKSFILTYRIDDRQRFARIGKTPVWTLEAARKRATKLRAAIDQDRVPARDKMSPVEDVMQYIAERL
jgi:Arm DNA-binding domain